MGSEVSAEQKKDHLLVDPAEILTPLQIDAASQLPPDFSFVPLEEVRGALRERHDGCPMAEVVAYYCEKREQLVRFRELLGKKDVWQEDAQLFFALGDAAARLKVKSETHGQVIEAGGDKGGTLGQRLGQLMLHAALPPAERILQRSQVLQSQAQVWQLHLIRFKGEEQQPFDLVYSSARDGHGLNGWTMQVSNYDAPTLMLLRTKQGHVIGFYSSEEWKSSSAYKGDSTCFLFSLWPKYRVLGASSVDVSNYRYFHVPSKTYAANVIYDGIAMGGQQDYYRFSLDADLKHGISRRHGTTYESDVNLLGEEDEITFEVDTLELWGMGGHEVMRKRDELSLKQDKMALKSRKVDRTAVAQDMNLLEMAGAHKSYVKDADHV